MFSLNNLVIHTFEPRTEKVVDNELIIDDDTLWVATCQQNDPEAPKLPNKMYERLFQLYGLAEAKSKNPKKCVECAVINFQEELELLDFMPLTEVLFADADTHPDDTPEEELD